MKTVMQFFRKKKILSYRMFFLFFVMFCFVACKNEDDGNNGDAVSGNGVVSGGSTATVCTLVNENDETNYYVFYGDKTVEGYIKGKLEYTRSMLCYEGDPTKTGTLKLKIPSSGATLLTFTVTNSNGNIVATESISKAKYIKKSSNTGNTGGNTSGDSGNTGKPGDNSGNGNGNTEKMFMGFDTVVTVPSDTSAAEISQIIVSLTSDTTLVFSGGINAYMLSAIATAMKANDSVQFAFDFSNTTGIKEWKTWLSGQETLYAISLPKTVTSVQTDAFKDCRSLKAITIPPSIQSSPSVSSSVKVNFAGTLADWLNSSVTSDRELYLNGKTLSGTVSIPNSVKSIKSNAFYGCTGLIRITIPSSVTSIGERAFSGCTGLTSVTIPNSVTSIGRSAFYGCTGLKGITIPNSVTSIGRSAFSHCSGLTSITIPNSVTSIDEYAFSSCTGLTSVTIPNNVTSIGSSAFSHCSGLTSITILSSVTRIESYTFYACSGLTSITIPSSVTSIDEYAFSGCSALATVKYRGTPEQWNKIYYFAGFYSGYYGDNDSLRKATIVYNYTGD